MPLPKMQQYAVENELRLAGMSRVGYHTPSPILMFNKVHPNGSVDCVSFKPAATQYEERTALFQFNGRRYGYNQTIVGTPVHWQFNANYLEHLFNHVQSMPNPKDSKPL